MHREAQESVYIHRGKNQVSRLLRPWHPHSSPDVSARPLSIQTQKTEFCCQPIRLQLVNLHMPLHLEQKAPREVFKKKLRAWGSGMKNAGGGGVSTEEMVQEPSWKAFSRKKSCFKLLKATSGWQPEPSEPLRNCPQLSPRSRFALGSLLTCMLHPVTGAHCVLSSVACVNLGQMQAHPRFSYILPRLNLIMGSHGDDQRIWAGQRQSTLLFETSQIPWLFCWRPGLLEIIPQPTMPLPIPASSLHLWVNPERQHFQEWLFVWAISALTSPIPAYGRARKLSIKQ